MAEGINFKSLEDMPHLHDFARFLDEFNAETPRGAALTAGAMIDDILLKVLQSFLVPCEQSERLLVGFNAPLGSAGARAAACVAMGLITDKEFVEAKLVLGIRNQFAHGLHVSFDTPEVVKLCNKMKMGVEPPAGHAANPRGTFTTACVSLILNLTNRAAYVKPGALRAQQWTY